MRQLLLTALAGTMIAGAGIVQADDLAVGINLSGRVAPGVYGEVHIGNNSPPPVVYEAPVQIVHVRDAPPPIYMNVPPDEARDWRAHCRHYNACNRPVYFVRSDEYEQGYRRHDERYDRDARRYDPHYDRRDDHRDDHHDYRRNDRHDDHGDRHDDHGDDHHDNH